MTLTGPQKIPFASQAYFYGGTYQGTAMEVNVGVLHTTEGTSLPSYGGGAEAPNVTAVPDFANQKLRWYQHFDVDRSARALVNKPGGVETNTANAFQVELVGTCDPATHTRWINAGVRHIYWPEAPDWALRGVADLVRWLADNHKIPVRSTVTWRAYPSSYGASPVRLTYAQWGAYYGWLGHQHVPENDHGDPGNINFARIIELALGEEDVTPEQDTRLKAVETAVKSLLANQKIAPWQYSNLDIDPRDMRQIVADGDKAEIEQLRGTVATLASTVQSLATQVSRLQSGAVDVAAVAEAVADELHRRTEA